MRNSTFLAVAFVFTTAALAQSQAQAPKTFASASDVDALIAKAKADHKDGQALIAQRILQLAPYNVNLEYRTSVGPASIHEKEAELFFVIDGSATLVTGGKLTEEK